MPDPVHVFVSHAHADNDVCDQYVQALRARGIDVWYDRTSAQAGHFLGTEIQRELEQRSAFVVLLTQHSLGSFWVTLETQTYLGLMAQDRTRLLLSVRIGPCDVPPMLNAFFWVDAMAIPFEQAIDAIAAALTGQSATSAQAPTFTPPAQTLPPPGPAPMPKGAAPALHLTPMSLYNLGFRGYSVGGVECVLPPICLVPGGIFTMGSDKAHDPDAHDDETPQYPVPVGDFAIGQHPVTVAEYACAVRARAVREPPPYDSEGNATDWQTQLTHLDHPVACVSWQDTVGYTHWLAGVTGQPWRLPTEAEWEKMARWDPQTGQARRYAWGDSFDTARCNTYESGIGTTTPVGRYPTGANPYGAQDVAGNVQEWTSSIFEPYPYNLSDGREDQESTENRVIRGGSWNYSAGVARAAYRDNSRPDGLGNGLGFRLAWAPVRSGSA